MARQYLCNMCGKQMTEVDLCGMGSFVHLCGYGSVHDGRRASLDLCPKCLDNLFEACLLSPFDDETDGDECNCSKEGLCRLAR